MITTLSDIFFEAAHDAKFRADLLENHQAALSSKGYELSAEDTQLLNDIMTSGEVTISTSDLLQAFSYIASGSTFPIPPPWEPK